MGREQHISRLLRRGTGANKKQQQKPPEQKGQGDEQQVFHFGTTFQMRFEKTIGLFSMVHLMQKLCLRFP